MEACNIQYSPFLQCSEQAFFSYNAKNLCLFHLYLAKKKDDCCICLDSMDDVNKEVIVLSCGHMLHLDCLSKVTDPYCPMCRRQMNAFESTKVFYPTVIEPLMLEVFALPPPTIKCVLSVLKCVLYLATFGYDHIWWIWNKMNRRIERLQRSNE
jgi:hypothetical protein